jgi:hypothetical protein
VRLLRPARDERLMELLVEAGGNATRATHILHEMLASFPERPELAREVLLCEQEGDRLAHDVVVRVGGSAARARAAAVE